MFASYAPIYDQLGEEWLSLRMLHTLRRWLAREGYAPSSAADVCCGTGAVAVALAIEGLEVFGVDCAQSMLEIAQQRAAAADVQVRWLCHDVREFELPAPVDLITAFYDSLNYLLSAHDLQLALMTMARWLRPDGVLAFDLNTSREYELWLDGSDQVARDSSELFVLQRRSYEPSTRLASGTIIWMQREGERWRRGEEVHRQRAHSEPELLDALDAAGLTLRERLTVTGQQAPEDAPRILYIATKKENLDG